MKVRALTLVALHSLLCLGAAAEVPAKKPNIVVIVADVTLSPSVSTSAIPAVMLIILTTRPFAEGIQTAFTRS